MSSKVKKEAIVPSDEDKETFEEYSKLCIDLNMDSSTTEAAWESYAAIKQNYSLEGNQMHWLACALYVACRNANLPTVGRDGTVQGNGVSLTRLLRSCKLSLIQFFNKAKKWADMSNLKRGFRDKIDRLERNFAVSNVIFKKYQPIFVDLFKDPSKDPPKANRSRKQKKQPCTPGDVFDFCWSLFVRIKADFPAISDDLVNSYHLLLCCVDYVYSNAVLSGRTDLLNEAFEAYPKEEVKESPCTLEILCRSHDGIINEVKSIREHWWKPHIKKFFDKKVLKGDHTRLSGILDPAHFEVNAKAIRKDYEAYILSIGEHDESVFLGEDACSEIGTPTKTGSAISEFGEKMLARRNLETQFDGSALIPSTPLSGKHYLRAKEHLNVTPVKTATYLVSRLNALIAKREPEPSPKLLELLQSCDPDPTEAIGKRVKEMGEIFCQNNTNPNDQSESTGSFENMRLKKVITLFYKLLENILLSEKKMNKPLSNLLEHDLFHRALFTCSLEIVIFSYNSQRTFPWILDTFHLEAIHFYKVIEIIIRAEDLPRDVVKHLQRIEEKVLESRAWTSDSPLWEQLANDPAGVPSCEEVSLPAAGHHTEVDPGASPLSHHRKPFTVVKSPIAGERFKSPVVTAVARRQLFGGKPVTSPVRAGQSLLASPTKTQTFIQVQGQTLPVTAIRTTANGQQQLIIGGQPTDFMEEIAEQPAQVVENHRPKRTGSIGLFFRKVYNLAHLRLDLLCKNMRITEEDVKRKIWTTFEYTLQHHTDLMKDRHIDTLLMCSLYIISKVVGQNKDFLTIMTHYRAQPQSASHVYRSVLLRRGDPDRAADTKETDRKNPPPTPSRLAATSTIVDGEERGDIIKFYNTVFMEQLKEYCLKFKRTNPPTDQPPLSPLPKLRAQTHSPCRKVSDNHSIFIRPLRQVSSDKVSYNQQSPMKPLSYVFSRSPVKNLAAINAMMRTHDGENKKSIGKRLLSDDVLDAAVVEEPPIKIHVREVPVPAGTPSGGAVNTKLELILGDRSHE